MPTTGPSTNSKDKCNTNVTFTFIKHHATSQSLASILHPALQLSIALINVAQADVGSSPCVQVSLTLICFQSTLASLTSSLLIS